MDNVIDFKNALMREFIRLCRGNDFNELSLLEIGETVDRVLEEHYRKFPDKDTPQANLPPCKIGDTVWAYVGPRGKWRIRKCVVCSLGNPDIDPNRIYVVDATNNSSRVVYGAIWGTGVFESYEECVAAVGGRSDGRIKTLR